MKIKFDYIKEDREVYFQGILLPERIRKYFNKKYFSETIEREYNAFSDYIGEDISAKFSQLKEQFFQFVEDLRSSTEKIEDLLKDNRIGTSLIERKKGLTVKGKYVVFRETIAIKIVSVSIDSKLSFPVTFDYYDNGTIKEANGGIDTAFRRVKIETEDGGIILKSSFLIYDEDFKDYYPVTEEEKITPDMVISEADLADRIKEISNFIEKYQDCISEKIDSIPEDGIEMDI